MNRRTILLQIAVALILLACQVVSSSAPPTNTPGATPSPTSIPLPTATLTATPLPRPETLAEQAAALCEAALTAPITNQVLRGPIIGMVKETYAAAPAWSYKVIIPYFTASSAADVQTIFCVEASRSKTGTYNDGESAFRRSWSVRVVAFPSGEVLAAQTFRGGEPPLLKTNSGPGYGSTPTNELFGWVMQNLHDPSVFFVGESVARLWFFPDGRYVAAATARRVGVSYSGTTFSAEVSILDAAAGEIVHRLRGHTDAINALIGSPDGRLLASASFKHAQTSESMVKIWDAQTGRELHSLSFDNGVFFLAFSPDGSNLVVSMFDRFAFVDPASGAVVQTMEPGGGQVLYRPDGKLLLDRFEQIDVLDPVSGQTASFPINCMQIAAADGSLLANCINDGQARITDAVTAETLAILPAPDGTLLALSPGGLLAVTGGGTRVFDTYTGSQVLEIEGLETPTNAAAFSADGSLLATGTGDGFVKIWHLRTP